MRTLLIAFLFVLAPVSVAVGQQKAAPGSIIAPTESGDEQTVESCVEVEIDGAKALDCLNRRLQGEAARVNPIPNLPPIDARSQDIHLGIVNGPAVQQQYGQNFGRSVVPYRPAAPVFRPPLAGH